MDWNEANSAYQPRDWRTSQLSGVFMSTGNRSKFDLTKISWSKNAPEKGLKL